ncbi:MAG: hypothetical protein K8I82_11180, partial [Anaerolineae bacterium]|nr:hypothetical protein [Anaerolineae bacterium]
PLHRLTRAGTLVAEVWRTLQKSPQTLQQVRQRAAAPGASLSECVAQVRWLYTTLVQGEYTLSLLLSLLNSDYSEPTLSTAIYTDLVPLRDLTSQQDEVRLALIQGKLPRNKKFLDLWDLYLEKHGHRGIYETDIASPRYRENPRPLLDSLLVSPRTKPDLSSASPPGWWVRFLWSAIQAQENLRYEIMKGFEQSRARLLKLAGLADADLWMLTPEEVMQLETGWQPDEAFFQKRRADLEHDRRYDLPDQFSRFDNFGTNVSTIEDEQQMRGISLNQGRVRGVAWVLDEPDTHLPEDFDEGSTILVTRAVDAGWIPTFSHVAGVVVETGDDFSPEAILLREIGVPAVTHVEGVTHKIQTGDEIVLRADQGIVERCHLK